MFTNKKEQADLSQRGVLRQFGGRGILLVWVIALLLLGTAGAANSSAAQPESQEPTKDWTLVELPPQAQQVDLSSLMAEKERGRGRQANPKLDSVLAELVTTTATAPAETTTLAEASGLQMTGGRVQVEITVDSNRAQEAEAAVTAAGGQVTKRRDDGSVLQAWLPPQVLATVAANEAVFYVRQPSYAMVTEDTALAALTEGAAAAGAQAWHNAGLTGQGVKVAIIDAGFLDYPSLLGDDLPATVTAKTFVDFQNDSHVNGVTPHGTACAEIIHDMAPDAQLYLLQVSTATDLGEAVDYAISQGVDVISTSLAWLNVTPGDGTGYFAQQANKARAAGILWVTAAGNYRETHWGGVFNDTGDGSHEFDDGQNVNFFGPGNGQALSIPGGNVIRVFVRWDDWQGRNQDYDLHLVRWTGSGYSLVASSTNLQTGQPGQTPAEQIVHVTSGAPSIYGIVVERVNSNRAVNLEIFSPNLEVDVRVYERSLGNLADVAEVFTVAALDVDAPYPQESYSSQGPTNGPGGTQNGGKQKPDIAAYANVSTESYLPFLFNGTSSAAPHVAGAAALVIQARPFYTVDQVRSFLQGRAFDLGTPGQDTLFGFGRLLLGAPLLSVNLDKHNYVPVLVR